MKIGFASDYASPYMDRLADDLHAAFRARGHEVRPPRGDEAPRDVLDVVINVTSAADPRANHFRFRASQFICTLAETSGSSPRIEHEAYAVLVKTMSNLVAYVVHDGASSTTYLAHKSERSFRCLAPRP